MIINDIQTAQIDLLIHMFSELQALRDIVLVHLSTEGNSEDILKEYRESVDVSKSSIIAQLTANYGGLESIDDLINRLK